MIPSPPRSIYREPAPETRVSSAQLTDVETGLREGASLKHTVGVEWSWGPSAGQSYPQPQTAPPAAVSRRGRARGRKHCVGSTPLSQKGTRTQSRGRPRGWEGKPLPLGARDGMKDTSPHGHAEASGTRTGARPVERGSPHSETLRLSIRCNQYRQ